MTQAQLITLIQTGDMGKCIGTFQAHCMVKDITEALKQFDPKQHKVMDKAHRRDKMINKGESEERDVDVVFVARLPLAIQKKIVKTAAFFLGKPKPEATTKDKQQEELMKIIAKVWDSAKLDYSFGKIAKTTMRERQCAELWFMQEADTEYWAEYPMNSRFKLGMKILSESRGDKLYPVFDEYGDMIAFGREYKIFDETAKEINHFDIYTADKIYKSKLVDNAWHFTGNNVDYSEGLKSLPNIIKKIPVIYYHQPLTEWDDVQELIDRLETKMSNHADTNDYYDSPIFFAEGEIEGFSEKGESGKVLQGKNGAKASFLSWDNAPESMKMEMENLKEMIFSLTHTPDISFDKMKSIGIFSGVALKTFFKDARIKAIDHQENFGESVQRRINYIKSAIAVMDSRHKKAAVMEIKPGFESNEDTNDEEQITVLNAAVAGGILSQETAISLNPLVKNPEEELTRIQNEETAATENQIKVNTTKMIPSPADN